MFHFFDLTETSINGSLNRNKLNEILLPLQFYFCLSQKEIFKKSLIRQALCRVKERV